jgi:prepilin-type N-terminal cleavage/methylation domain-containing protein
MSLTLALKESRGSKSGFTLLEIIVVLAILAVFSIPAMTSSGTGLSTAAEQVSGALAFARSEAIAKRTVVRFGIATAWNKNDPAEYRKYSLWAWDRKEERYVQIQNWETLPQGLVFETKRPRYFGKAAYAKQDASSSRGDFVAISGTRNEPSTRNSLNTNRYFSPP